MPIIFRGISKGFGGVGLKVITALPKSLSSFSQTNSSIEGDLADATITPVSSKYDSEGNLYVLSNVSKEGSNSILLSKYDTANNLIWRKLTKILGGDIYGSGLAIDELDNPLVAGYMVLSGITSSIIIKYNPDSTQAWELAINLENNAALDITTDDLNNSYITGYVEYDNPYKKKTYIAKIDPNGILIYFNILEQEGDTEGVGIDVGPGGEPVIVIRKLLEGNLTCLVAKLDGEGDILWEQEIICPEGEEVDPNSIIVDANNEIYILADYKYYDESSGTPSLYDTEMTLLKLNELGELDWSNTLSTDPNYDMYAQDMVLDELNNSVIIIGTNSDLVTGTDGIYVGSFTEDGDINYQKTIDSGTTSGVTGAVNPSNGSVSTTTGSSNTENTTTFTGNANTGIISSDSVTTVTPSQISTSSPTSPSTTIEQPVLGLTSDPVVETDEPISETESVSEEVVTDPIPPEIEGYYDYWMNIVTGAKDDRGIDLFVDSNNNVYSLGHSNSISSPTKYSLLITKYNAGGVTQWQKAIGDDIKNHYAVAITSDNKLNITILWYKENSGTFETHLSRINATTGVETLRYKLNLDGRNIKPKSLVIDSSDNIYILSDIVDTTRNKISVIKLASLSSTFNYLWSKELVYTSPNEAKNLVINFGNLLISSSFLGATPKIYLTKLSTEGVVSWTKIISHSEYNLRISEVRSDKNENIIITGNYSGDSTGILLGKLDPNALPISIKGIYSIQQDLGVSISVDEMNNIILGGYTKFTTDVTPALYIAKLSNTFTMIWQKIMNGSGSDILNKIKTDKNNIIYFTGWSNSGGTSGDNGLGVAKVDENFDYDDVWTGWQLYDGTLQLRDLTVNTDDEIITLNNTNLAIESINNTTTSTPTNTIVNNKVADETTKQEEDEVIILPPVFAGSRPSIVHTLVNQPISQIILDGFHDPNGLDLFFNAVGNWPEGITFTKLSNTTVVIEGTPTTVDLYTNLSLSYSNGEIEKTIDPFIMNVIESFTGTNAWYETWNTFEWNLNNIVTVKSPTSAVLKNATLTTPNTLYSTFTVSSESLFIGTSAYILTDIEIDDTHWFNLWGINSPWSMTDHTVILASPVSAWVSASDGLTPGPYPAPTWTGVVDNLVIDMKGSAQSEYEDGILGANTTTVNLSTYTSSIPIVTPLTTTIITDIEISASEEILLNSIPNSIIIETLGSAIHPVIDGFDKDYVYDYVLQPDVSSITINVPVSADFESGFDYESTDLSAYNLSTTVSSVIVEMLTSGDQHFEEGIIGSNQSTYNISAEISAIEVISSSNALLDTSAISIPFYFYPTVESIIQNVGTIYDQTDTTGGVEVSRIKPHIFDADYIFTISGEDSAKFSIEIDVINQDYILKFDDGIVSLNGQFDYFITVNLGRYSKDFKLGVRSEPLYEFTSFTFTNCNKTGTTGPSYSQASTYYNTLEEVSATHWINNTSYYTVTSSVQLWTVPIDGTYKITNKGAGANSGYGAVIISEHNLVKGEKIRIMVGQMGTLSGNAEGGSGGTFVVKNGTENNNINGIISIAGGSGANSGGHASVSANGATGTYAGGSNGGAGQGYGGAGFFSNGPYGNGSFINGGAGVGYGGFGGGSSGTTSRSNRLYSSSIGYYYNYYTSTGGGGGYSGGGGGYQVSTYNYPSPKSGGGGSITNGFNSSIYVGNYNNHGSAKIELLYRKVPIYNDFSSFIFTNCGAIGRLGPELNDALTTYDVSANQWLLSQDHFNVINGIQHWRVPKNGLYRIEARGAQGGVTSTSLGRGAIISGDFHLVRDEMIHILVGQQGLRALTSNNNYFAGGGGGTFVVKESGSLMMAAGGGGGNCISGGSGGQDASLSQSGNNGDSGTTGGTGGNAGANIGSAIGGSGWLQSSGGGSSRFAEGGTGAISYNSTEGSNNEGGFGGGGGVSATGWNNRAGGGGGYSGGGASSTVTNGNVWGGGGGSYNGGGSRVESIGNTGHGKVTITLINYY